MSCRRVCCVNCWKKRWDKENALSRNSVTIVPDTEETAQMAEYLEGIVE